MKKIERCPWSAKEPIYMAYHDEEWGVPERDDRALYEKLVLDGFQAGLSWITILKKRENFRRAFDDFNPEKIARYNEKKIAKLLDDAGIIRSRAKIESAVRGARVFLDIMEKERGGFSDVIWRHVDGKPLVNRWRTIGEVPAQTAMSQDLAKDLKNRGFNFCGPVIVYAFAQAIGMVNDHLVGCPRHAACIAVAKKQRPIRAGSRVVAR